jgi:hypothetical protein
MLARTGGVEPQGGGISDAQASDEAVGHRDAQGPAPLGVDDAHHRRARGHHLAWVHEAQLHEAVGRGAQHRVTDRVARGDHARARHVRARRCVLERRRRERAGLFESACAGELPLGAGEPRLRLVPHGSGGGAIEPREDLSSADVSACFDEHILDDAPHGKAELVGLAREDQTGQEERGAGGRSVDGLERDADGGRLDGGLRRGRSALTAMEQREG